MLSLAIIVLTSTLISALCMYAFALISIRVGWLPFDYIFFEAEKGLLRNRKPLDRNDSSGSSYSDFVTNAGSLVGTTAVALIFPAMSQASIKLIDAKNESMVESSTTSLHIEIETVSNG